MTNVDPSIWVALLEHTPLTVVCVVLALVVRYLYRGKEALHDKLLEQEKNHQTKTEEVANLLHEINLVSMEKSFSSSQRWQETIDESIGGIEDSMVAVFKDHLKSEEDALAKINTCLSGIDALLQELKDRTGTRIAEQVKDIQTKIEAMQGMLERRRDDIREDHRRSREDLLRQIKEEHAPLTNGMAELKGKIDDLL